GRAPARMPPRGGAHRRGGGTVGPKPRIPFGSGGLARENLGVLVGLLMGNREGREHGQWSSVRASNLRGKRRGAPTIQMPPADRILHRLSMVRELLAGSPVLTPTSDGVAVAKGILAAHDAAELA